MQASQGRICAQAQDPKPPEECVCEITARIFMKQWAIAFRKGLKK